MVSTAVVATGRVTAAPGSPTSVGTCPPSPGRRGVMAGATPRIDVVGREAAGPLTTGVASEPEILHRQKQRKKDK